MHQRVAPGMDLIDVEHLGQRRIVAVALSMGRRGVILVDPGPASTLPRLEHGLKELDLAVDDLNAVLLTHIHLDHAAATGLLVRRNPAIAVYVHRKGARHLADPGRLLNSARRIYRNRLHTLFGEIVSVPAAKIHALEGGERIDVAGRPIETDYTPGHAKHHVSYFDMDSGTAFVGDTGGVRLPASPVVAPATPPPDIDLELWDQSIRLILNHEPARIFLTHFGPAEDPEDHLDQLRTRLGAWSRRVGTSLEHDRPDQARAAEFGEAVAAELARQLPASDVETYALASGFENSWYGLARYLRRG